MNPTSWHLLHQAWPILNAMKTEPPLPTQGRRTKQDPATQSPINLNAIVLEKEILDTISIHCGFHGTARNLEELLNTNYPQGQPEPITTAWNNLGADFLEELHILAKGETHYTQRRKDYLYENPDQFKLNLYQINQALAVLGYDTKYDTIKKWAKRGHLTQTGEGTYSLTDAIIRHEMNTHGITSQN